MGRSGYGLVTERAPLPSRQVLMYGFGPDADFEGRLTGALERIESGGALRVLDALFVARDPEDGEHVAIDLAGGKSGGGMARLLDFRLDPGSRRKATERVLNGPSGDLSRQLAAALEPGAAILVLLLEHRWAQALEDAVAGTGGAPLAGSFVEAAALADLAPAVLAAVPD